MANGVMSWYTVTTIKLEESAVETIIFFLLWKYFLTVGNSGCSVFAIRRNEIL